MTERKLQMESADPQNQSEWRGHLQGRLARKVQPSVEENELYTGYEDVDDDDDLYYY